MTRNELNAIKARVGSVPKSRVERLGYAALSHIIVVDLPKLIALAEQHVSDLELTTEVEAWD